MRAFWPTSAAIVLLRLCLLALCCALAARAAWSENPDEAPFGACAPNARHANVPALKGLTYDDARRKIIAAGWTPRVTRTRHGLFKDENGRVIPDDGGAGARFWSRGYKEVAHCFPTGIAACVFNFSDGHDSRLVVYTVGEERLGSHITVDVVELQCHKQRRMLPLSWQHIEQLSSASDRTLAKSEVNEIHYCDDPEKANPFSCADARVAVVPLPEGSDLLLVRYPAVASCERIFAIYGPAEDGGQRRPTVRFCGTGLEALPGPLTTLLPDLRLTDFRCGRDKLDQNIYCKDALFRWNGKEWHVIEKNVSK